MSRFTRPLLPVALPVLALLLVAAGPAGVGSQSGSEAGKGGPAGASPDVKSAPIPSPPTPQPAPDRPHTRPKAEESPPADRGKSEGETQPEAKPEAGAPPEAKPETGAPPEAKPETGAPPEAKPEAGAPPKNLKPIAPEEAVNILGRKVYGPADEDMGMVIDVLVDSDGRPRAAVIDFGGFLGVGSRKIAIDWELLQFRPADRTQQVRLGLGRADVQAAPEYKPSGQPAEVVAPPPPPPELVAPDAEK
jgi:PRC-barrel domain